MNPAQVHLALNHAPLFLSITGAIILLIGLFRKNNSFINLSRYLLIAAALFTIPVFLTGEGTEELVEHLPGVNESAIESHEEMAKISLIIIASSGAIALAGLLVRQLASLNRILLWLTLALSLASFGTMAQTAHLGGLIRHSEIQNGNQPASDNNEGDRNEKDQDDD